VNKVTIELNGDSHQDPEGDFRTELAQE